MSKGDWVALVVSLLLVALGFAWACQADTHILAGMGPGEFVVEVDSLDASGMLVYSVRELSPDSVYFFPRYARWDAYIMGGNATGWASCYGMTGWMPTRSTETPGYIALEHRGIERYGVVFVYFDTSWVWTGHYDYIIKQQ